MATTHAIPDTFAEMQAVWGDLGPAVIVSHTGLTVPASSLTMPAVAANGYVLAPGPPARLVYVSQPAVSVTLSGGNGTYWLALHTDLSTAVAGWTRRAGSHFVWQMNATQPANPAHALVWGQITVAGGVITAVTGIQSVTHPPMSRQNSGAVAITGGTATLSSLTCTGVASAVVFSATPDTDNAAFFTSRDAGGNRRAVSALGTAPSYFGGAVTLQSTLSLQGLATLAAGMNVTGQLQVTPTAGGTGVLVSNPPAGIARALYGNVAAGADRFNLYCNGTADNFLSGALGVGGAPIAPNKLHVVGTSYLSGNVSIGTSSANGRLTMVFGPAQYCLWMQSNQAGLVTTMLFVNQAGSGVGSITQSDTATAYNTSSDRRLKERITALTGALDVMKALNPVAHVWKATGEAGVGFVADEVQQVVDGVVTGEPDAVDKAGQIVPQGMDMSKLVPWLTAALKETLAQVEALTARVADLEAARGA